MKHRNVHLFPNRVGGFQDGVPFAWVWRRRAYMCGQHREGWGIYPCPHVWIYVHIYVRVSTLMNSLLQPLVSVRPINTDRSKSTLYNPSGSLPSRLYLAPSCMCWVIWWVTVLAEKNRVAKWGNASCEQRKIFLFFGSRESTADGNSSSKISSTSI